MNMKLKDKRTFLDSVKNCLDGLKYVIIHEKNFQRELVIALLVIIISFIFRLSLMEWIIIIIFITLVLILELINTLIEKLVDLYTVEYNKNAKIIKDISASMVVIGCLCAVIGGLIIFIPHLL